MNQAIDENKSNKKIALGALFGYIALAVNIISGLVFIPLISSHYGQDQYGILSLSNSFIGLFMTDIGLGMITTRFLSIYRSKGQKEEIEKILGLIYRAFFVISAILFVLFLVLYFFTDEIFGGLTADEHVLFKEIYLISAVVSVAIFPMHTFDGILNAYEEYAIVKGCTIFQKLLYIALVSLALVLDWPLLAIAVISTGSNLVTYLTKYIYIRVKVKCHANFRIKISGQYMKEILAFAIWQTLASVLRRLSANTASPVLGVVSDSAHIAIYSVAAQIEVYAFEFCNIAASFFLPKVSRIWTSEASDEEKRKRIFDLATKVGTILSSLTILMMVGFASCGNEFIDVWMNNPNYALAYPCTLLLMGGEALISPNAVLRNCFYFDNNIKYLAIGYAVTGVIFLALAFVLGYFFDAVGVATAALLSNLLMLCFTSSFYKIRVKIPVLSYYKAVYLRQLVPIAVSLAIGLTLHFFLPLSSLVKLFIIIPSVAIPFGLMYWFFVYTPEMRNMALGMLFKKRRASNGKQA